MERKKRKHQKRVSVALMTVASISGCAPMHYVGGPTSGAVLVVPSKAWSRPNTTLEENA